MQGCELDTDGDGNCPRHPYGCAADVALVAPYRTRSSDVEAIEITRELAIAVLIDKKPMPFGLSMGGQYHPARRVVQEASVRYPDDGGTGARIGDWLVKDWSGRIRAFTAEAFHANYEARAVDDARTASDAEPDAPLRRYHCERCDWYAMARSLADAQQQHWFANVNCTRARSYSSVVPSQRPRAAFDPDGYLLLETAALLRNIVASDPGYSDQTRRETMVQADELDALAERLRRAKAETRPLSAKVVEAARAYRAASAAWDVAVREGRASYETLNPVREAEALLRTSVGPTDTMAFLADLVLDVARRSGQ